MTCHHCRRRVATKRQLCGPCFTVPEVRSLYPCDERKARRGIGNGNSSSPLPAMTSKAIPGTHHKIEVMILRAMCGEALFHPDDLEGR